MDKELFSFLKVELDKLGIDVTFEWGGHREEIMFKRYSDAEDYYWVDSSMLNTVDLAQNLKKEYAINILDDSDILWNNLINEIKTVLRMYKIKLALDG